MFYRFFLNLIELTIQANRLFLTGVSGQADAARPIDIGAEWTALFDQMMQVFQGWELPDESLGLSWLSEAIAPGQLQTPARVATDRFSHRAWREDPAFKLIMDTYLSVSTQLLAHIDSLPLEGGKKHKLKFLTRFFVDAISPCHFFPTNPEAVALAVKTRGRSLKNGLDNLLKDIQRGRISLSDESAFALGETLAATPGAVVYENPVMQLIHYAPTTPRVHTCPLVIVPPCINKFYILDLQEKNSFVKYCLDQGHRVFLISWVNPDARHRNCGWDDYISQGLLKALEIAADISESQQLNALGWCIGGVFLATALAVLHGRNQLHRIASATFLTTLLDYSDAGDIGLFVDKPLVGAMESYVQKIGFLPGMDLFMFFALIRANDLLWSHMVNHYLKGKSPAPFDILYWNSDPVNLAAPVYISYLKNMYLDNRLMQADALRVCGIPLDLKRIGIPSYFLAAKNDHIVPWESALSGAKLLSGPKQFVLTSSGHVSGVINPVTENRRRYWINGNMNASPQQWLASSVAVTGSWWPHWSAWLDGWAGKKIDAPKRLGSKAHRSIEKAPGRYVKRRIDGF
jgi:poly[(R)-3-hydroxyalkanoate] polymerase subunit PhaC